MTLLLLFDRQKTRAVKTPLLRRVAVHLLEECLNRSQYEVGAHLIGAAEMAGLNETFLGHNGSTDVITFNHDESNDHSALHGEIFISVDDAVAQAAEFDTTWQAEIVRYLAHGLLHLEGYDDTTPSARRTMKREENKLVKELSRRFDLGKLGPAKHGGRHK